ncbi:TPA: hypothetical protein ACNUZQ_004087 [Citrobacter braakii]
MADANRTTNARSASFSLLPEADLFHFPLAEAFRHLDVVNSPLKKTWHCHLAAKRRWPVCITR